MTILAIDTSASLCAAAVFDGELELGRSVIDIGKGHAEHLMGVIEAALAAANVTYAGMSRIVVAIGPGSFTGIRVGVSTARGLALALGVPAIGISNLDAVAAGGAGPVSRPRNHAGVPVSADVGAIGRLQSVCQTCLLSSNHEHRGRNRTGKRTHRRHLRIGGGCPVANQSGAGYKRHCCDRRHRGLCAAWRIERAG